MNRYRWSLIGCFFIGSALLAQADEIRTLTGKSITGSLDKITDKEITLKDGANSVATPMAQVIELNLRPGQSAPSVSPYFEVVLVDDSLLRCTKIVYAAKDVKLTLTSGITVQVPLSALVSVLRDAGNEALRKQWVRLLKAKTLDDRIFVAPGGDLNSVPGSLGAIDEEKQSIKFRPAVGKELDLEFAKLQGLQFLRVQVPSEQAICKIIDTDGNQLVASKLVGDASQVHLVTPFGAKVSVETKLLAKIDFNFGKLTFLSDLDMKATESGFLGGFTSFRKDANLDGNPIILADKKYDKGLSMYAGTELEFNLGGKYKEFKAILGADSRIAEEGQGKVVVSIYSDRVRLFTQEVSTKTTVPLAINVKDVEKLRIVVSGANFTNYGGHATLANAHVSQ